MVRRFGVNPWTALPSLETSRDGPTYVSKSRRWIAALETTGDPANRRYVFWDADSGKPTPASAIADLQGLDVQKATASQLAASLSKGPWVKLPDNQNMLSGDTAAGRWWKLDEDFGEVISVQETQTGHPIARLVHDSRVRAIAISRQGSWIATVSDGKVFLWTWSHTGLIDLTCSAHRRQSDTGRMEGTQAGRTRPGTAPPDVPGFSVPVNTEALTRKRKLTAAARLFRES